MTERRHWVAVANFAAVYEAEFAVQTLADAGIVAQVKGEQTGIFGPGWMGGVAYGGVTVLVTEEDLEEARWLLFGDDDTGPDAA